MKRFGRRWSSTLPVDFSNGTIDTHFGSLSVCISIQLEKKKTVSNGDSNQCRNWERNTVHQSILSLNLIKNEASRAEPRFWRQQRMKKQTASIAGSLKSRHSPDTTCQCHTLNDISTEMMRKNRGIILWLSRLPYLLNDGSDFLCAFHASFNGNVGCPRPGMRKKKQKNRRDCELIICLTSERFFFLAPLYSD